jgi:predicted amidohydrolase YtcJ
MSVDGGLTGRNARFSEPYVGEPCNCGMIRIPTEELERTVESYHKVGHRVCIHAMGDIAMDMALDALDKTITAHPRHDHRHRIEHMGNNMVTPERIARMKRLGVLPIPNVAFLHHVAESMEECLGPQRMKKAFNLRQMLDAGIPLTQGSDAPGYWPIDVLRDLGTAVTRRTWQGGTFDLEESITVAEALRMCTATAAFSGFEERFKGTVELGKLADLTVLAEDIFDVAPNRIKDVPVDMAIVNGNVAHARVDL